MNHNTITAPETLKFESGIEFKDAESQQATAAELAAFTAEWTAKNADYIADHASKTGMAPGMRLDDFKDFVAKVAPGMGEDDTSVFAARFLNDASRFKGEQPLPEDRSRLDAASNTAMVSQSEIMKYSVHMMKESGLPFEGEAARGVEDSIKAGYAALGYDIDDPGTQLSIKEVLDTK